MGDAEIKTNNKKLLLILSSTYNLISYSLIVLFILNILLGVRNDYIFLSSNIMVIMYILPKMDKIIPFDFFYIYRGVILESDPAGRKYLTNIKPNFYNIYNFRYDYYQKERRKKVQLDDNLKIDIKSYFLWFKLVKIYSKDKDTHIKTITLNPKSLKREIFWNKI